MKMNKSLLSITALAGLLTASVSFAAAPTNRLGYIDANTTARAVCGASRFFPGGSPGTLVQDKLAGGLLSDFLITNTSNKTLAITQIDVYEMNTSKLIVSYTPSSVQQPLPSVNPADPAFKWSLAPNATTRLSHEATLPPSQVVNPFVLWNTVVFTIKAADDSRILAPLVYSDYAEYMKSPVPDATTNGQIIDRIRTACVYR
jgi:hypothetical protein